MSRIAPCAALLVFFGLTTLCLSSPTRAQSFDLQNAPAYAGRNGPANFLVLPVCASSHYYQSLAIVKELSSRGHSVQFVLTDEGRARWGAAAAKLPNVQVLSYNISGATEFELRQLIRQNQRSTGFDSIRSSFGVPAHSHPLLQDTELHQKIQEFSPDLALCDFVLAGGAALADKLGIPKSILYITGILSPLVGHSYGSGATHVSTVPQWMTLLPQRMTFFQRVQNIFGYLMNMYVWTQVIEPQVDKIFWQHYNIPPYSYLKSNRQASLVLMSHDWATANAEPLAPHMVTIGAITASPAKALPSGLEGWMQSAGEHGVVYASLGTTAIPEAAELRAIAQGLSAIAPTKALWKLSESDMVSLRNSSLPVGSNVKIVNWAPQNDVLGHPNLRAFFTQGGGNSFNEASYHGVPMVGMPLFAEQPDNIAKAEDRGYGLSLSVKKLDTLAKDLETSLKRLLNEPSFKANAVRISHLMRAHRLTPSQVAVDALEHAAWTKGSRHLQPLRDDLNWFQTNSLDVILFLGVIISITLAVLGVVVVLPGRALLQLLQRQGLLTHAKTA